jgi:hypothetical protein
VDDEKMAIKASWMKSKRKSSRVTNIKQNNERGGSVTQRRDLCETTHKPEGQRERERLISFKSRRSI